MKLKLKLLTVFMFSLSLFLFTGCQQEVETINDTTAPAEVTKLSVTYDNSIARLTWTNPTDKDFVGVQISMEPAEGLLANPISLGASVTSFTLTGLRTDVTYVVTIKTFDSKFNYSEGVSKNVKISGNQGGNDNPTPTPGGKDDPIGGENEQPENTDTIPPAQVENLVAEYSAAENSITVSWTNPLETDFVGTKVVYGKTNLSEKTTLTYDKSFSSIVIPGIVADDSEYTIFVSTTDTSGNLSEARSVTVQAVNNEIVECDVRTGDYVLSNNTYVRKEYYSELTQEERNSIVGIVLVTDSAEPLILGTKFPSTELAWTNTPTGTDTYFTDIAVQVTASGYDYTFTGDVDGSDNWDYICKTDAIGTANEVTTYPTFYYANMYPNVAGLTNTDFADGWYVPSVSELWQAIKYLSVIQNSLTTLGVELPATYTSSVLTCSSFWSSSQSYNFDKSAYKIDYTTGEITTASRALYNYVWVFHKFDAKKITKYEYGTPEISSVWLEASKFGETYLGNIFVAIQGNNLKGYEFESPDSYLYDVVCISNTKATGYIIFDDTVGNHVVTINCGTASGSTAYDVIESEKCFAVGDILFTDGTRMKAENVKYGVPDSQAAKAFGVIYNTSLGGLKGSVVGIYEGTELNYESAFTFADSYGTTGVLIGTDYSNYWELPYGYELKDIYDGKDKIDESFIAVKNFGISNSYYWCQYNDSWVAYRYVNFSNGYYGETHFSDFMANVLVVSNFKIDQFIDYEVTTMPRITNIEIETAGEGYTGDLVVTITGNNFKGHSVTCSDDSFGNVKYVSDSEVTATITCDGIVRESDITVTIGSSSMSGLVRVLSSENCISDSDIGKIVLSDGSFVTKDEFNSYTMTPIAVVVGSTKNGGQALGIGLQKGTDLQWAPNGTTGYNTNFIEIQEFDKEYNVLDGDGSDNWKVICKEDFVGAANASINYPVFNFANTYGETAGLYGTDYKDGWYVPSYMELINIYENKAVIEESLSVVGDLIFGSNDYWSSSQSDGYYENYAMVFCFYGGGSGWDSEKSNINDVLVVRAFNVQ